jgi:hypothetical protein
MSEDGKPRYFTRPEALEMIRHAVDAAASATTRHGRGMPGGQKAFIEGFIKAWTPRIGPQSLGGTRYTVADMTEILRSAIDGYLSAQRWDRTPPSPTLVLKDWTEAQRASWEDGFPLDPLSHRMRDRRDDRRDHRRRSQAYSQVSMTHGP